MSDRNVLRALAICGPTSSGKSELAVLVADAVGGEIVNADSRQVYRDLPIGTGSPPPDLMRRVPHHLYGFVDPCNRYSAGAYVDDALAVIEAIKARRRVAIVVGGTGLYVEALAGSMTLDRPIADDALRDRIRREARVHPHEFLNGWLHVVSPEVSARLNKGDRYRTLRGLEAVLAQRNQCSGGASAQRQPRPKRHAFLDVVVLSVDRSTLAARIAARVSAMFASGLADEALATWRRCADAPALTGLGYAEALAWHRGEMRIEEAVRQTIERTRRYAKRQETWFRRMRNAMWVDGADHESAGAAVAAVARELLPPA